MTTLVDANCNIIAPSSERNAALLQQYRCLYSAVTTSFIPAADTVRTSIIDKADAITTMRNATMKGLVDDTAQQSISGWTPSAIAFVVLCVFFLACLISASALGVRYLGGGYKNIASVSVIAFMVLGVFVAVLQKLV